MRFHLSIEVNNQLLRDLKRHFHIGPKTVRQDLKQALAQAMEVYRRDVSRQERASKSRRKEKQHAR